MNLSINWRNLSHFEQQWEKLWEDEMNNWREKLRRKEKSEICFFLSSWFPLTFQSYFLSGHRVKRDVYSEEEKKKRDQVIISIVFIHWIRLQARNRILEKEEKELEKLRKRLAEVRVRHFRFCSLKTTTNLRRKTRN